MFGKEASLFVSSGTMANCASMMTLAQTKGDSVILGNWSHIANYERGGISGMGGIMPWVIANDTDGTLPLNQIAPQRRDDLILGLQLAHKLLHERLQLLGCVLLIAYNEPWVEGTLGLSRHVP